MLTTAVIAGCSTVDPGSDDSLFLTQLVRPASSMDALFDGVVTVDAAGCFRLGLGDSHVTMVWPYGYRLISTIEGSTVVDEAGREIGRIGSQFRLGGGIVSSIPEGLIGPARRRQAAMARCPGQFWIAASLSR